MCWFGVVLLVLLYVVVWSVLTWFCFVFYINSVLVCYCVACFFLLFTIVYIIYLMITHGLLVSCG